MANRITSHLSDETLSQNSSPPTAITDKNDSAEVVKVVVLIETAIIVVAVMVDRWKWQL